MGNIIDKMEINGKSLLLIEPTTRKEIKQFKKLPFKIYENKYPLWVPHLSTDVNDWLNFKKNPQFNNGFGKIFLVYCNGEVSARAVCGVNNTENEAMKEKRALFTLFECVEDYDVFKFIMDNLVKYAKEHSMEHLWGPLSPDFGDDYRGLLIDGYDIPPYFYQSYNPPYYRDFIEKYGFVEYETMVTMDIDLSADKPTEKLERLSNTIKERYKIRVEKAKIKEMEKYVKILSDIYQDAFDEEFRENYPGFVPPRYEDFMVLAKALKPFMVEDLLLFAFVKDEPAGAIFCFPDYNAIIKDIKGKVFPFGWLKLITDKKKIKRARVMGMAVKKAFQGKGVNIVLAYEVGKNGKNLGYVRGESGTMHDKNYKILNTVSDAGGKEYKHYRHYGMKI